MITTTSRAFKSNINRRTTKVNGEVVSNLRYADDTTLIATSYEDMQSLIERVRVASEDAGLFLNVKKTKSMQVIDGTKHQFTANGDIIEDVDEFNFLGFFITNRGGSNKEIKRRIGMARSAMFDLNNLWKSHDISLNTKIRLVSCLVFSVATYGCESWTLTQNDWSKLTVFELWSWRKILQIGWKEHKTNDYVLERVNNPRSLVNIVTGRKLAYFGHISRRGGESLEKLMMQGRVEGRGRRGRPKARWMDQIKAVTGRSAYELTTMTHERLTWRFETDRATKGRTPP